MNKYDRIVIHYTFQPSFALKIGSGHQKYGIIDNTFRTRNHANLDTIYSIPGTSVKGRLRSTYQKYAHLTSSRSSMEEGIFGKSGKKGWAHFSDLVPKEKVETNLTTNTSIDRFRKAAKFQSLRIEEYVEVNEQGSVPFEGSIEGYRTHDGHVDLELAALLLSILGTNHLGGDKTTGFGKGKMQLTKVAINDKDKDINTIQEWIQRTLLEGGKNHE